MKPNRSEFVTIRGIQYHCRIWGRPDAPRLFCLHGWMDVSASFQFLVDALAGDWQVIAPDWRGYGLSGWSGSDSYWFPDYLADLDRLLEHFQPEAPATLVGHSMGGNVASLYAGIRPERVARLVNLEGFGMPAGQSADAPGRYAKWLAQIDADESMRDYADFAELAARLQRNNPRLMPGAALFLAKCWGREEGGRVSLRADPAHRRINPVLYRLEEAEACWRQVSAPVLWVEGAETRTPAQIGLTAADLAQRKACFARLEAQVIADAGHMLHHDQPQRLAGVIEDFLAKTGSRG
ncbi:MAG: alpha/beta hydrolase [Proteobacteria bacterium]|nr:alpha/beta hydrolase [Pseudomonadota bacterium]